MSKHLLATLTVLLLVVISACGSSDNRAEKEPQNRSTTTTGPTRPFPENEDGTFRYEVISSEMTSTLTYDDPNGNEVTETTRPKYGRFLNVTIKATNQSSTPAEPPDYNMSQIDGNKYIVTMQDTQGRVYNPDLSSYFSLLKGSEMLNPGTSSTYNILFDIPSSVIPRSITFARDEAGEAYVTLPLK